MNCQVEYKDCGDYLLIRLLGQLRDPDIESLVRDASGQMMNGDHTRVFIDSTAQDQSTSTFGDYRTVQMFMEISQGRRFRIVELVSPERVDNFKFLENVARNRGISFRVFDDQSEALTWLRSGASGPQ